MKKKKFHPKKIFENRSPVRWKAFLWIFRTVIAFFIFLLLLGAVDLLFLPSLQNESEEISRLLKPEKYDVFETRYNREYYELRQELAMENGVDCEVCSRILDSALIRNHINLNGTADSSYYKKVVLVFDDGPDPVYTPQILEILNEKNVPAAFFITGIQAEKNLKTLERIYEEGHEIGNHTFYHPRLSKVSVDRTLSELKATKRLIESSLGISTLLFRPPFSEQPKLEKIPAEGINGPFYYNIPESIDPRDYEPGITSETIIRRVERQMKKGEVILLHDGGGNRSATVEALPVIIDMFNAEGYEFISVAAFLGLKRRDVMPPLQDDMDSFFIHVNRLIFFGYNNFLHFIKVLFIASLILAVLRYLFIAVLAGIQASRSKKEKTAQPVQGKVSIIVPAYNEEVTLPNTVRNLMEMDYPDLEILVVDDGSKDNTLEILHKNFGQNENIRIYSKSNSGKAQALNYGIRHSKGEFIVCIDADTMLKPNAIRELLRYFNSPRVASVAGNVKVGNERNSFTYWQSIEYITSQNFDRRAFDLINAITVVPGAIGAFRRSAMLDVGMFKSDTLAEDCELSMRLLKHGYSIRYNPSAIAVTESPENLSEFMKQRVRWMYGIMQSFWKHREMAFNPNYKAVGFVAYPNMILYQLILPFLAPLADIIFLVGIIMGHGGILLGYFLLYLAIEALGAVIAFAFERESLSRLIWLIPQRLVYRQLLFVALVKAIIKALRGEIMKWGILKRTGNVDKADV